MACKGDPHAQATVHRGADRRSSSRARCWSSSAELACKHGVHVNMLRLWRSKYAGLDVSDLARLKELESENAQMELLNGIYRWRKKNTYVIVAGGSGPNLPKEIRGAPLRLRRGCIEGARGLPRYAARPSSRSRLRYWMASATCSAWIASRAARSAMVRATRAMRSRARAEN